MSDILADIKAVSKLNGDTYSLAEVLGLIRRSANEIELLRAAINRTPVKVVAGPIYGDPQEPPDVPHYDDRQQIADITLGELRAVASALERARTVLGNMARENDHGVFVRRWPINHEPLRANARDLLPTIDEAIRVCDLAK